MILVDANVLLTAYDERSPGHREVRRWLEQALGEEADVRVALTTILAFIRIATNPNVYEQPRTPADALAIVAAWLARPNVRIAGPTERHWALLADVAEEAKARGPMLMDAHLATLAIEHGAAVATSDRDFRRFPRLKLIDPAGV